MSNRITKLLPWWLKIAAKIVLARVPVTYGLWQSLGLFRHGYMDTSTYALQVFDSHVQRAGLKRSDLIGKTVLEIGPGDSIATALIAYSYGASAILIDSGNWARNDVRPYRQLARLLQDNGFPAPDLGNARSINDILKTCNGTYITSGLAGWSSILAESVDFVFSQAVLEHIRKDEFLGTQQECWRVMKKNAIATHKVDLRDHLADALNNLRFDVRIWESDLFARSGFYTNRIQMTEMVDFFRKANFSVKLLCVARWESLPTPKHKMSPAFARIPDDELCVSGFSVRLIKEGAYLCPRAI